MPFEATSNNWKTARSWKSFDWNAMARLHEKGLISNPAKKAKTVVLSEEGFCKARKAFEELFGSSVADQD